MTGENFKRFLGNANRDIKQLKDEVQKSKEIFWQYTKQNNYYCDEKALKLMKQIEVAEYNLYCAEYEDNRRRNWN
jgi:hypothetical protein